MPIGSFLAVLGSILPYVGVAVLGAGAMAMPRHAGVGLPLIGLGAAVIVLAAWLPTRKRRRGAGPG